LAVVLTIFSVEAYVNSPTILLWMNPQNGIKVTVVSYPSEVYRSQSLPITVCLSNVGDPKTALVDIVSIDNPTLSSEISLGNSKSATNTTFMLPIISSGQQAFAVNVYWIGPGGFCQLQENSTDEPFTALAADYQCSSGPMFASRSQDFDWTLTVTNVGNTPANLAIQLVGIDPLIVYSSDTQQIANINVGETKSVDFQFVVPSSASLGDHTITVSFTTTYPNIPNYNDCTETYTHDFVVNIQQSPVIAEINNAETYLVAVLGLVGVCMAMMYASKRKRGGMRF
jgi:hypothetical protein